MTELTNPMPEGQAGPQPLKMGALLESIFHTLRMQFRLFFGIAALPAAAMTVFMAVMLVGMFAVLKPWEQPNTPPDLTKLGMFWAVIVPVEVLFVVMYALFEAATNYAAFRVLAGFPTTFPEAYRAAWSRAGRYFWLQILRALIIGVPFVVLVLVLVAFGALSVLGHRYPNAGLVMIPAVVLGEIGGFVWAVFALIHVALAYPASISEDLTAWRAMRRSFELTRGAKGRVFVVGLVLVFLNYAGVFVLEIVLMAIVAIGMLVGAGLHLSMAWAIGGGCVVGVVLLAGLMLWSSIGWSALCIGTAALYRDQRLRADGAAAGAISS